MFLFSLVGMLVEFFAIFKIRTFLIHIVIELLKLFFKENLSLIDR